MKKSIFITLFLIIQSFAGTAVAGQSAADNTDTFKIKLPDGLYLYQPWTNWQDYFSPLVIVENGRLIEPYALLKKNGKEPFDKKYLNDKRFNVYVGKESIGKLSGVKLEARKCDTDEFLPFYSGEGIYEGDPLPAVENTYNRPLYANFNRFNKLKAVAAPGDIGLSAQKDKFIVTEEDRALAIKAIELNLVLPAIKRIENFVEKLHKVKGHIANNSGKLDSLIAVDIDGNGQKDLLGIYTFYGMGIPNPNSEHTLGGSSEMLFVLWDTGKVEVVMSSEHGWPIFSLGGLIDIDLDGAYELIVQKSISTMDEPFAQGMTIYILRHGPWGWGNIYHSGNVCADIVH